MEVTIPTGTISTYAGSGTVYLRVVNHTAFVDSEGAAIARSDPRRGVFYKEITCSTDGGVITYPEFKVSSTTDISPSLYYSLLLFDANKNFLGELFRYLKVSDSTPQTLAAIVAFSEAQPPTPPANIGGYESLAQAVTGIGDDVQTLQINDDITVESDLTVPANITLDIRGTITVADTKTLTINSMSPRPSGQMFIGDVKLGPLAADKFDITWWGDDADDMQDAINYALASVSANDGGRVFVPLGVWNTDGQHTIPSNTILEGVACGRDGIKGSVIKFTDTETETYVLRVQEAYRNIVIQDVCISTGATTLSNVGLLATGSSPNTAYGLTLRNVLFAGTAVGPQFKIEDASSNDWEVIGVHAFHCAWITPADGVSYECETVNVGVTFYSPLFNIAAGATACRLTKGADHVWYNPTCNGPGSYEWVSVFNRNVSVTTLNGSALVTLNSGTFDDDDLGQLVSLSGGATADAHIIEINSPTTATLSENVTGTAASATMAISYRNPPQTMGYAFLDIQGDHGNLRISGGQDEGLQHTFIYNGPDQTRYPVKFESYNSQALWQFNQDCRVRTDSCSLFSLLFRSASDAAVKHVGIADTIDAHILDGNSSAETRIELSSPRRWGENRAGITSTEVALND